MHTTLFEGFLTCDVSSTKKILPNCILFISPDSYCYAVCIPIKISSCYILSGKDKLCMYFLSREVTQLLRCVYESGTHACSNGGDNAGSKNEALGKLYCMVTASTVEILDPHTSECKPEYKIKLLYCFYMISAIWWKHYWEEHALILARCEFLVFCTNFCERRLNGNNRRENIEIKRSLIAGKCVTRLLSRRQSQLRLRK
jgi:hypothetical protein